MAIYRNEKKKKIWYSGNKTEKIAAHTQKNGRRCNSFLEYIYVVHTMKSFVTLYYFGSIRIAKCDVIVVKQFVHFFFKNIHHTRLFAKRILQAIFCFVHIYFLLDAVIKCDQAVELANHMKLAKTNYLWCVSPADERNMNVCVRLILATTSVFTMIFRKSTHFAVANDIFAQRKWKLNRASSTVDGEWIRAYETIVWFFFFCAGPIELLFTFYKYWTFLLTILAAFPQFIAPRTTERIEVNK